MKYLISISLIILCACAGPRSSHAGDLKYQPLSLSVVRMDDSDHDGRLLSMVRQGGQPLDAEPESSEDQSSPWRKFPYVLAGTGVLYANDVAIQNWIQDNRNQNTDKLAEFAKQFGEPETYGKALAGLYLYGVLFEDDRARRTVNCSLNGLLLGAVVTQTMKYVINRDRPNYPIGEDPFEESGSRQSFPSGHTMVAFLMATIVSSEYGEHSMVRALSYTAAGLTGWSRMNDNDHWASDILFGSYVGYTVAKLVTRSGSDKDTPATRVQFEVYPVQLRFTF